MNTNSLWKFFQTENDEFILLSDSQTIKKITGKHASKIVTVLQLLQSTKSIEKVKSIIYSDMDTELADEIIEWLIYNHFFTVNDCTKKNDITINLIGEFSYKSELENDLISSLKNINIKHINTYNLANNKVFAVDKEVEITLLIAPFWFDKETIINISTLMKSIKKDFLYVELYESGISFGPLMNLEKGTVCLNCLKKRKLFNFSTPDLVIKNIANKTNGKTNTVDVLSIGNFKLNTAIITNELNKIIFQKNKGLYNKSIFIDYKNYTKTISNIIKTPDCHVCNPQKVYNPL